MLTNVFIVSYGIAKCIGEITRGSVMCGCLTTNELIYNWMNTLYNRLKTGPVCGYVRCHYQTGPEKWQIFTKLNNGQGRYSDGRKLSGWWMLHILKTILSGFHSKRIWTPDKMVLTLKGHYSVHHSIWITKLCLV